MVDGRMDCGHHYEALVWDDDIKKTVCSACQAEAVSASFIARAIADKNHRVRNLLERYKLEGHEPSSPVFQLADRTVVLEEKVQRQTKEAPEAAGFVGAAKENQDE